MSPRTRNAPLDLDGAAFRALGHALVDNLADYLDGIAGRPISTGAEPGALRHLIGTDRDLPENGVAPARLLADAAELLLTHSLHNGHPRFMGYITSSAAPIGMLGDLLASAVNANVGAWTLSPVASEIEGQTVRWIADLVGYPTEAGGLLVSGGNVANTTCFWAARVAAGGPELRSAGRPADGQPLKVYATREAHTWLHKAADVSGVGTDAIRWIPTDETLRMDVDALARALDTDRADGARPMMVVATAGTVSTGAVDPLRAIAEVCRTRGVWLHVDGAYGGFAAMLPDAPEELHHLSLADSLALDPHKWLYAPLEAGCALVRDARHLREAFSYHPPYYHFGVEATNYLDLGIQNSRGFRALKVWLALQHAGRAGYRRMLADDIRLARLLHEEAERHPLLEAHVQGLSISTFRFVPWDLRSRSGEASVAGYLNRLNEAVQARLEREGEVFLSNAVVDGRYLLRGCIVNFRTDEVDVREIAEIVGRVGERVDAELRNSWSPAAPT